MSDTELSSLDDLKSRHNKEKKELQAKITSLKHSIPKNDKKKKKDITATIEQLESDLKTKQENELAELQSSLSKLNMFDKNAQEIKANSESSSLTNEETYNAEKKPTKAQKRREKKEKENRRREEAALLDEQNAVHSQGRIESDSIVHILRDRNLQLTDIAPDGDCMYNALAHQLNLKLILPKMTGSELRQQAANFIRLHKDDFLPFLTDDDGEMLNDIGFEEYCLNVERTSQEGGAWGGDAELRAISCVMQIPIEVLQGNGQVTKFGEQFQKSPLVITFHRFAYSLGEHYNSTTLLKS